MRRIVIITEDNEITQKDVEFIFSATGNTPVDISVSDYKPCQCACCGKYIFEPIEIDGKTYGSVCAKKAIQNLKSAKRLQW